MGINFNKAPSTNVPKGVDAPSISPPKITPPTVSTPKNDPPKNTATPENKDYSNFENGGRSNTPSSISELDIFKPKEQPTSALDDFLNAKNHGKDADNALDKFKQEKDRFNTPLPDGSKPTDVKMMSNAIQTILDRNKELKDLYSFSGKADVSSPENGAVFWSGDKRDSKGKVEYSAMNTAQHYADKHNGVTVEMTEGGKLLDNYLGPDSFKLIKDRFNYNKPEGEHKSEAGKLWDVLSERYGNDVKGNATAIHAAPQSDPYFSSDNYQGSTWISKEKPAILNNGGTVTELFGDQLGDLLKSPDEKLKF